MAKYKAFDASKVLSMGLNQAIHTISERLFPTGYDVSETEAPETYEALCDRLNAGKSMIVYSGASEDTIYGDREINWAFRAWHDWCHWRGGFDFTAEGEAQAVEMQIGHIMQVYGDSEDTRKWAEILRAEVNGQLQYLTIHGDFPQDQAAFIKAYLDNPEVAISQRF